MPKTASNAADKSRSSKAVSGLLLITGASSLLISYLYVSLILAFIGLSLLFWGALLLYIRPAEYTKKIVLDAVLLPSIETLNRTINELGYEGNPVYLPPEYLTDPRESRVYIPKNEDGELPTPQVILSRGDRVFTADGILAEPPGGELARLFEDKLGTSFTKKDLQYVRMELPKLLIEDLELVENLEILEDSNHSRSSKAESKSNHSDQVENRTIIVRITDSVFKDLWKEVACPVCSAIACVLTRVIGTPVTIESLQLLDEGEKVQVTYQILSRPELRKAQKTKEEIAEAASPRRSLSRIAPLFLIVSGLIIPALMGWIIWYDMTVWGKDFYTILFGSRTGELISLGIDMKVIYYIVLGLILFTVGLLASLLRREE